MSSYWLVALAGLFVLYGTLSSRLKTTALTGPMIFVAGGFVVGPDVVGFVDAEIDSELLTLLLEITLAVVLFSDATTINESNWREEATVPGRLLLGALPLTILFGFVVAVVLLTELDLWEAALVGAILAPTDASLGQAVISNRRVPQRIRQGLNVESGLNDGIALPIVLILIKGAEEAEAGRPLIDGLAFLSREILVAVAVGVAVGYVGAKLMLLAKQHHWMAPMWMRIAALALAAAAYGLAVPLQGSGFIAAWVTGLVLAAVTRGELEGLGEFGEAFGSALTMISYFVLGAFFLGAAIDAFSWEIALYAVLSLTVIRMAAVALALIGSDLHRWSVVYLGWFGPRGLASVIFAGIVLEEADLVGAPVITNVVMITVALSVFVHGATSWAGSERYADWFESQQDEAGAVLPEAAATPETRVPGRHGRLYNERPVGGAGIQDQQRGPLL